MGIEKTPPPLWEKFRKNPVFLGGGASLRHTMILKIPRITSLSSIILYHSIQYAIVHLPCLGNSVMIYSHSSYVWLKFTCSLSRDSSWNTVNDFHVRVLAYLMLDYLCLWICIRICICTTIQEPEVCEQLDNGMTVLYQICICISFKKPEVCKHLDNCMTVLHQRKEKSRRLRQSDGNENSDDDSFLWLWCR